MPQRRRHRVRADARIDGYPLPTDHFRNVFASARMFRWESVANGFPYLVVRLRSAEYQIALLLQDTVDPVDRLLSLARRLDRINVPYLFLK